MWEDLQTLWRRYHATRVLVDCKYPDRRQEVFENAWKYSFIPTQGHDRRLARPFKVQEINPFEGKRCGPRDPDRIAVVTFDSDIMKRQTLDLIQNIGNERWYVYQNIEQDYRNQVTSEELQDGVWVKKRRKNHGWDCEVIQTLAASMFGFLSSSVDL
jgi:hypothetical protein